MSGTQSRDGSGCLRPPSGNMGQWAVAPSPGECSGRSPDSPRGLLSPQMLTLTTWGVKTSFTWRVTAPSFRVPKGIRWRRKSPFRALPSRRGQLGPHGAAPTDWRRAAQPTSINDFTCTSDFQKLLISATFWSFMKERKDYLK